MKYNIVLNLKIIADFKKGRKRLIKTEKKVHTKPRINGYANE